MMYKRMQLVTFLLPETYLEGIERLVELGCFESRSEAVRLAVEEMIKGELRISRRNEIPTARRVARRMGARAWTLKQIVARPQEFRRKGEAKRVQAIKRALHS